MTTGHPYRRIVSGLGYTASSKRKILSADAFDRLFPKTISTDPIINDNGTVHDTVEYCARIVANTLNDTKLLAPLLKKGTLNDTCRAIFDYFYKHYQYEIDKDGVEQLRRPARAFKDRKTGIDCDCFSISVSSVLTNLGIPHYFRIVKMYGRDYFQHIYVIVPTSVNADVTQRRNYYVIDPVVDRYDLEAPGITFKKDRKMNGMPIQYLNGTDMPRLGEEFNGLGDGLGDTSPDALYGEYIRRKKAHLINTRNFINKHPRKIAKIYQPQKLAGMYDQLIGAWDNEQSREAMLDHLSGIEDQALQPHLLGLSGIIHGDDHELFGFLNMDEPNMAGLGDLGKVKLFAKKAAAPAAPTAKKGVFTKIKQATAKVKTVTKKATAEIKKAGGNVKQTAKKVAAKTKEVVKKVAKAVVKYSPVMLAARAGFLLAMKTNFGRLASRAYWGYYTLDQAKKAGITVDYYNKSKAALAELNKAYAKTKGEASALQKAIVTGRAAKKVKKLASKGKVSGLDMVHGYAGMNGLSGNGLGVVTEASITAALTLLTPLVNAFKKIFAGKKAGTEVTEDGREMAEGADGENIPQVIQDTVPAVTNAVDKAQEVYDAIVAQPQQDREATAEVQAQQPTPPANTPTATEMRQEIPVQQLPPEIYKTPAPPATDAAATTEPAADATDPGRPVSPEAQDQIQEEEQKSGSLGLILGLGIGTALFFALKPSDEEKEDKKKKKDGLGCAGKHLARKNDLGDSGRKAASKKKKTLNLK